MQFFLKNELKKIRIMYAGTVGRKDIFALAVVRVLS